MSAERRGGLRVRLLAIILGAALFAIAPLAIAVLLQVRDALYSRRVADARERLSAAVVGLRSGCAASAQRELCEVRLAEAAGLERVAGCERGLVRRGEELVLCEPGPGGGALRLRVDLSPVRQELAALDARLLVTLGGSLAVLVSLAVFLLERGIVRRLSKIDTALEHVGTQPGEPQLLPEGGDSVGRVGAAVNRLAQRLHEEQKRTRAQIGALETANRDLREARADLARSERLASVGRLAAGVAHEVGNPVSALIGYAALMRERLQQGKDVGEYAERVEREATRIDRILRDLLDLARPRAAQLERVDLQRAVSVARSLVDPQPAWQGVALEPLIPGGLPAALGEEHYVVQVLVNLLANAARAGARKVRIEGREEANAVLLEVADDGRGIAPEVLPRLFEPFVTTAAPGQGTGLGLALCHATMERIGGSISARSSSAGAVFELRFRRAPA